MNTYTKKLPTLWWLRPWHHARRLHAAVTALNSEVHNCYTAIRVKEAEINWLKTNAKPAKKKGRRRA